MKIIKLFVTLLVFAPAIHSSDERFQQTVRSSFLNNNRLQQRFDVRAYDRYLDQYKPDRFNFKQDKALKRFAELDSQEPPIDLALYSEQLVEKSEILTQILEMENARTTAMQIKMQLLIMQREELQKRIRDRDAWDPVASQILVSAGIGASLMWLYKK